MMRSPIPTRAEASDVANAIFDGTDAVMLSGETASGEYPIEAVEMMDRIAREVERSPDFLHRFRGQKETPAAAQPDVADAACASACELAESLSAKVVAGFTASGSTAWRLARNRPRPVVVALTPSEEAARQLSVGWGIVALVTPDPRDLDHVAADAVIKLRNEGLVVPGDRVVITAGVPLGESGSTNMLRVETVGPS